MEADKSGRNEHILPDVYSIDLNDSLLDLLRAVLAWPVVSRHAVMEGGDGRRRKKRSRDLKGRPAGLVGDARDGLGDGCHCRESVRRLMFPSMVVFRAQPAWAFLVVVGRGTFQAGDASLQPGRHEKQAIGLG